MKVFIKFEEFFLFILTLFLFRRLDYSWGIYALFFFMPDLSMIGYWWNPRFGAVTHALAHHKGLAVALYGLGYRLTNPMFQCTGLILRGHSRLDRVLGYGLQHSDSFQNTHLGILGRTN